MTSKEDDSGMKFGKTAAKSPGVRRIYKDIRGKLALLP